MAPTTKSLPHDVDTVLRLPQVEQITGRSAVSIWRDEKSGRFPKRRRIGVRSVGWLASEVIAWIESRPTV